MKKLHYAISLCLLLSSVTSMAQYVMKDADRQYESFKYARAISLYEQAYSKKASLHAAERLGDCHRFNNNYAEAERWYAIAIGMPGSRTENMLFYAHALQNNSKYTEARAQYEQYALADKSVTAEQKNVWLASCDSAISWMKTPDPLQIDNYRSLNSGKSDWSAVPYIGGVVFTSDRFIDRAHQEKKQRPFLRFDTRNLPDPLQNGWTGNDYLHLFVKPGNGDSVRLFPLKTGSDYHMGSASFTKDGKEVFFTLTRNPGRGRRSGSTSATVHVEIYSSRQDASGKWSEPLPFTHNNVNTYSVGDPFITGDGIALYFASNMPGGTGGTDLYVCYRTATGEWGPPLNLKAVNTPGNERSPALTKDNILYFASDGRIGMGGLDLYRVVLDNTGKSNGAIRNMRYPLNSPQDDFALGLAETGIAYLSSNRGGGAGSDDIYAIAALLKEDTSTVDISIAMQTPDTAAGVPAGTVGDLTVPAVPTTGETPATTAIANDRPTAAADNTPQTASPAAQDTDLPDIYFDFNTSEIRPDAQLLLDRLAGILAAQPESALEVGSHTDSRGADALNLALSQRRAASVVAYLVSKGLDRKRIIATGYGETKLRNKCANGVSCSEDAHKKNRRTEFRLVKI
jgi:outer membrane protein OmpA-like peptidoglycan-associated protein/tetratricopeptide (TPR) repeat protein